MPAQTRLVATSGRPTGSAAARRLRSEGRIPGVLYGHGMEPVSVSVERRDLRLALAGAAGANTVLDLQVDGRSYPAIVKELQRHPVKRTVSHIDFLQVSMHETITVSIPLRLEGEAKAVLVDGGLVDPAVDAIEVTTTPTTMPSEFVVDISRMRPGGVIRLGDLPMPAGVTPTGDPEMPIVTVLAGSRVSDGLDAEELAELEGESADGGEAADGGEGGGAAGEDSAGSSGE